MQTIHIDGPSGDAIPILLKNDFKEESTKIAIVMRSKLDRQVDIVTVAEGEEIMITAIPRPNKYVCLNFRDNTIVYTAL